MTTQFDTFYTDGKISLSFTGSNINDEFTKGDEVEIILYRVSNAYRQFIDLLTTNSFDNRSEPETSYPRLMSTSAIRSAGHRESP